MMATDLTMTTPVRSCGPGTVAVLVITSDNAVYRRLESIIGHSNWRLHRARRVEDAERFLASQPVPVVITEDGAWREALERLSNACWPAPRVIVASRLADDPLWQEVLEQGGYNVIQTPFEAAEIYWVISNAWRDWKAASERPARAAYAAN